MLFRRRGGDPEFPKGDQGRGSLDDYKFDLLPANKNVTLRLAGSDPHQDLLRDLAEAAAIETAIARRTDEEERTDLLVTALKLRPGEVVADIGCGSGFISRKIAKNINPRTSD